MRADAAAAGRSRARAAVLFTEDFDQPPRPAAPAAPAPVPPPTWAAVEAARLQGRAEGRLDGLREAASRDSALAASALATIGTELAASRAALREQAEQAAVHLSRMVLRGVAAALPDLCAAHGPREAAALLRLMLPQLRYEPEVVVRASPALMPALQNEIRRLDADEVCRIVLQPVPGIPPGDIQLRWQDATAERDTAALCAGLLQALTGPAEPPAPAERTSPSAAAGRADPVPAPAPGPAGAAAWQNGELADVD